MKLLHNLTFKRKLSVLTLLSTTSALVLAGAVLVAYEVRTFRSAMVIDVSAQAKILANLSTAALKFNDPVVASEMLNELKHEPYVVAAALFDSDGNRFVSYQRDPRRAFVLPEQAPAEEDAQFRGGYLHLYRKAIMDGQPVGTVFIASDMNQLYRRIGEYLFIVFGVLAASCLFALWLSFKLQRIISAPVFELCDTARRITDDKDFTLRARKFGSDEIGEFTDAFNQMLTQIQSQDSALTRSRRQLDALVHSIDGIVWECTPDDFQFTFVSRQSERLLGYPPEEWMANPHFWQEKLHREDDPQVVRIRRESIARGLPYHNEYRMMAADGRAIWIRESGVVLIETDKPVAVRGIFQDVTEQKLAAEELDKLNRQLVDTSRLAGMAEVATGVLHNVGNVLNSVSVSATLVNDRLRESNVKNLCRATAMLREQDDLVHFLTQNPKGQILPRYLGRVADDLAAENTNLIAEMTSVSQHIEHIKQIVAMQQSYAKVSGAYENLSAAELVKDALRLNAAALERHRIQVVQEFDEATPAVTVDRHKVLQILINLFRNAKYALEGQDAARRKLVIQVAPRSASRVKISLSDNGVGIASDHLLKVFNHGFTTKKDGHGFGLHSGANAAKEMGGSLTAHSDGIGCGATFSLELPVATGTSTAKSNLPERKA